MIVSFPRFRGVKIGLLVSIAIVIVVGVGGLVVVEVLFTFDAKRLLGTKVISLGKVGALWLVHLIGDRRQWGLWVDHTWVVGWAIIGGWIAIDRIAGGSVRVSFLDGVIVDDSCEILS